MLEVIRPAVVSFVLLTAVTGVVYPAIVTGIAKVAFASQADGSVIAHDGKATGSSLIAQPFTDAKYFWPRPSAAGANGYDGTSGSGSNLGPSNPALADAVKARVAALRAADPENAAAVPVDLVTASGSGLDPHISVEAARYQLARVARARGRSVADVQRLLDAHTQGPSLGLFGDGRINVLELNLDLDKPASAVAMFGAAPASTAAVDGDIVTDRARGFAPDSK